MKLKTTVCMMIAMLAMSSCDFMKNPLVGREPVPLPANLAAACDEPVVLRDLSLGAISEAAAENAARLTDCSDRHRRVVELFDSPTS